jgi:hypothetical protein
MADKDPSINPFVAIDNEKVYVTILKSSDKDGSMTVRLRSLSDQEETVNLSFPERRPERITVKPYSLTTLSLASGM